MQSGRVLERFYSIHDDDSRVAVCSENVDLYFVLRASTVGAMLLDHLVVDA